MARTHYFLTIVTIILLMLFYSGCSAPAAPPTLLPPTEAPSLTQIPQLFIVTFDENGCTYSGPSVVPIGEYSFVLKDLTGQKADLYIEYFIEDKTTQDYLALQGEPGKWFEPPDWSVRAFKRGTEWNESLGLKVYTFSLTEIGENLIYIGGHNPPSFWFCPPIWVIEASSDYIANTYKKDYNPALSTGLARRWASSELVIIPPPIHRSCASVGFFVS